jgi:hypothetical protein
MAGGYRLGIRCPAAAAIRNQWERRFNEPSGEGPAMGSSNYTGGLRPPDPLSPSLAGAPCPAPLRRGAPVARLARYAAQYLC